MEPGNPSPSRDPTWFHGDMDVPRITRRSSSRGFPNKIGPLSWCNEYLGGGFQRCFIFTPKFWGNDPKFDAYLFK